MTQSILQQFLAMGGYAAYVWSAFGIVTVILVGNLWWSGYRKRKIYRIIKRWWQRTS